MDRKFSAFRSLDHASELLPKPLESRPHLSGFLIITLILSSHLLTGLPSCCFPSGFLTFISFSFPTCLSYPPLADHRKNVSCCATHYTCSALLLEMSCIRLTKTVSVDVHMSVALFRKVALDILSFKAIYLVILRRSRACSVYTAEERCDNEYLTRKGLSMAYLKTGRSQCLRGLRRGSAVPRLLRLRLRIPPENGCLL
jgi:hypothetical protein